jgi:putative drug exporter of the RND superfamily
MISQQTSSGHAKPPFVPRMIRRLAVPIILAWLAIVFLVSTSIPSLEQVSTARSVSLSPKDAPSVQAMERMGQKFKESDSDSFAMVVLESQQRLSDDAHRYYNSLIRQLKDDPTHVQHIQDFWGDPGKAFDRAKNDDSFYLPPEVFKNPDFKRALNNFFSPDGKAVRFIVSHRGDPATPEGIARVDAIRQAAEESMKGTPLEDAKIYLAGTAATFKDWKDGSKYDLWIAGIGSLCLIFIIMLIITRSLIAALVTVGTVAISLGASFGLSVLVWQYILGIKLHWMVLAMSVIVLLAVGSDYNLLLVSRFKEEIGAGLKTGIIRSMGGTGKVVTSAGLVFAFTMGSMVVSDLRIIGQVGTTIGLGLLFDTLVVRSFMTPSIAALLGRWFWWPIKVRPRPASTMLRPYGTRPSVRSLLLGDGLGAGEEAKAVLGNGEARTAPLPKAPSE